MARILPGDWQTGDVTLRSSRVVDTLAILEQRLPHSFTVFHGVHWSRQDNGMVGLGDVDFIVLSPAGSLLLVEQKSGWLDETPDGIIKRFRGRRRTVRVHVDESIKLLQQRLEPLRLQHPAMIGYLLFCPDYTLKSPATAGLEAEQIVDSTRRDSLVRRIESLTATLDANQGSESKGVNTARLSRFLANELELVPDASALVGRANSLFTRMSGGLATWARRLSLTPFRLRVSATAGSGKTQLALALIEQAVASHRRVLYVCFNRPLADHIHAAAPEGARVFSYHQWCQHRIRATGEKIEFSREGVFEWLASHAAELPVRDDERTDCLIIDEGQDFSAQWRDDLLRLIEPDLPEQPPEQQSQVWWLDDPMQNLYDRPDAAPAQWPKLSAMVNYRSPRTIVDFLNKHLMPGQIIEGAGPISGQEIEFFRWKDHEGMLSQTKHAITTALRAGFRREDIVLITMVGIARSGLLKQKQLGPHRFKAFRGKYDLFGNPEYTDGDILIDTVYRFKGQSAPCIVLTECDFESLDDVTRRKLFVGLTRASMHLLVVLSEQAAEALGLPDLPANQRES